MARPVVPSAAKGAEATVTAESLQPVSGALELPLFPEDDLPESTSAAPAAGTATKAPASKAPAAKAVETGNADFDAALQDFLKGL